MRFISFITFLILTLNLNAHTCENVYSSTDIINEEIDLILTKQQYFAGENLVFGIQTFDGITGNTLSLSSIVYVEVLNQKGDVIQQGKIYLREGKGTGTILLSKKLNTDYYYVRAYTRYMQNLGIEHIEYKRFELINPFKNFFPDESIPVDESERFSIFFEGQNIILNKNTQFSAKCLGLDFQPIKTIVSVTDTSGIILTTTETDTNGIAIGTISFPNYGIFNAQFTTGDTTISVPFTIEKGNEATISIKELDDSFKITVSSSASSEGKTYLDIRRKNISVLCQHISLSNTEISIKKTELPQGLFEAILIDDKTALSHSYFINNPEKETIITIKDFQNNLKTRGDYTFDIEAPQNSFVSYSVIDKKSRPSQNLRNDLICFNKFFTYSELLLAEHDSRQKNFVLLKAASDIPAQSKNINISLLPEFEGDVVSGKVVVQSTKDPVSGIILYASMPDTIPLFTTLKTNKQGEFFFVVDSTYSLNELIFTIPDTTVDYQILVDNEFFIPSFKFKKENYIPSKSIREFIRQQMINIQVADAFKDELITQNTFSNIAPSFYGDANTVVVFDEYIKLPIMAEYIKELMPGVFVKKKRKRKYIRLSNFADRGHIGKNPLVLVNGLPVVNHEKMLSIEPKTVEYVKLFNYKLYFKDVTFDGIFDLRTKEPIDMLKVISKNNTIEDYVVPQRFSDVSIFNLNKDVNSRIPDFRTDLSFSFFKDIKDASLHIPTSDLRGEYCITITITDKNHSYSSNKTFEFEVGE